METTEHTIHALFAQLGLPDSDADIQVFIEAHSPVPDTVDLHCADFWSESQARMLRESLKDDSDWAIAVDQLNVCLRAPK